MVSWRALLRNCTLAVALVVFICFGSAYATSRTSFSSYSLPTRAQIGSETKISPSDISPSAAPTGASPLAPLHVPSTPTAPSSPSSPPSSAPTPVSVSCHGSSELVLVGFDCVNGTWFHPGKLTITKTVRVTNDSSPVYVDGDVVVTPGGRLILAGENAGIRISGCFDSPDERGSLTLDYSYGWPNKTHWSQAAIIQDTKCPKRRNIAFYPDSPGGCKTWSCTLAAGRNDGLFFNWTLSDKNSCGNSLALPLGIAFGIIYAIVGAVLIVCCVKRRRDKKKALMEGLSTENEPLVNERRGY